MPSTTEAAATTTLDQLLDLIDRRGANGEEQKTTKHQLLLVHPTEQDYVHFVHSLYRHYNHPVPNEQPEKLQCHVLNYTFISVGTPSGRMIEIYTIMEEDIAAATPAADPSTLPLLAQLVPYAKDIDVVIFNNCQKSLLTGLINSTTDTGAAHIEEVKKAKIFPYLQSTLHPFFNASAPPWKSCTVCLVNVSEWAYNAASMPLVDFIQQLLRTLLCEHYRTSGALVYFQFDLSQEPDKFHELCLHLQLTDDTFLIPKATSRPIKYNDVFLPSKQDSPDQIQILDDTFNREHWCTTSMI